jgi:hypothetical protein
MKKRSLPKRVCHHFWAWAKLPLLQRTPYILSFEHNICELGKGGEKRK